MLNVPFALANTIVLVVSSVWCQLGVLQAEQGVVRASRRHPPDEDLRLGHA